MIIQSNELIRVLSVLDKVPSRAGIPSSEFIKIQSKGRQLNLSLTSEVFGVFKVKTSQDEDWETFVDRSSFIPFINVSKDLDSKAPFKFKWLSKSRSLIVRCGARKGTFIQPKNISGYSEVQKLSGVKVPLTNEQKLALDLAAKYATPDPTMAKLNCVYIQSSGWVLASNERAAIRIQDPNLSANVPLPLGLLAVINDTSVTSILVSDSLAKVQYQFGYLCQTVNQMSAKQFPRKAIHNAINTAKKYPKAFIVSAGKLVPALERLNVYSSVVVRRDATVTLSGNAKSRTMRLTCKVPQGIFEESITIKNPLHKEVTMEWLLHLLLPLANVTKGIGLITVRYEPDKVSPYYLGAKGLELLVSRKAI